MELGSKSNKELTNKKLFYAHLVNSLVEVKSSDPISCSL